MKPRRRSPPFLRQYRSPGCELSEEVKWYLEIRPGETPLKANVIHALQWRSLSEGIQTRANNGFVLFAPLPRGYELSEMLSRGLQR
jgi:hypothetical protein